jgi:transcriptional regulator with XRE-family HTH domain
MRTSRAPDNRHSLIGQRLRTARLRARLSQQDIGQLLGVTYQQVNKYERGQSALSGVALLDLAAFLRVEVAWLLGEEGTEAEGPPMAVSRLQNRMLAALAGISDRTVQLNALRFIEALAQTAGQPRDAAKTD